MILSLACDTILILSQEALFCYPHHFRLLYSPQHSWGIRLFIQNMVHALSSLAEYAALRGVTITLEDFDGFLQPFARTYPLLWFMEHVPGLRYTLDIGNFAFSDEDVSYAAWLLKDYIVHVHCKDRAESPLVHGRFCRGLGQTPAGTGYLPMAKLLTDLEACDYDGYLAIEHFDAPDQLSFIEQSAAFLRQWVSE